MFSPIIETIIVMVFVFLGFLVGVAVTAGEFENKVIKGKEIVIDGGKFNDRVFICGMLREVDQTGE